MKLHRSMGCIIALLLILCGCGTGAPAATAADTAAPASTTAAAAEAQAFPFQDAGLPVEERVRDLLGRMTLEEKAGQMVQGELASVQPADVDSYGLGSVLSGGGSVPGQGKPEDWLKLTRGYQEAAMRRRLPIPLLYGIDAVHGHNNATGAVVFPHNIAIGAANSPELSEKMGGAVAAELRATGIPWTFSPCVAVALDPRWGRTYESTSSDPSLVTALSLAFCKGLIKGGVIPTAKHYVGDGGTKWGTSKVAGYSIDQGDAAIDEKTLRETHLKPYEALVEAGVPVVMASFSSWNGVKMHANKYLLTDVLKGELGFNGFVVSDWNGLQQLAGAAYQDKVAAAVNAGVDMLMEVNTWADAIASIAEGVRSGKIPAERVDDATARILRVKFQAGLFEDPYLDGGAKSFGTKENRALAAELAGRSLVLLKNNRGLLPFRMGQKIFVAGPAADDLGAQCGGWTLTWQGWAGDNGRTQGTTILTGLKMAAQNAGAEILTDPADIAKADVVLLAVGEMPYAEGVGDSQDLSLTGKTGLTGNREAIELAKSSGKPVAALIVAGREVNITKEIGDWDAAVMAWLPGTEGEGIAPVLFGERDFLGKLPMPWYKNVDGIGKKDVELLFPMGYGLTYAK